MSGLQLVWDQMAQPEIDSDYKNPLSKTEIPKEEPKEETMYLVETILVA